MLHIALERSWPEIIAGWRSDAVFRREFADRLRAVSYAAWFWECNRVSDGLFECVVIDAPSLAASRADPSAFSAHLRDPVNTFSSLGGDATLLAPSATGDYSHFAAFLRTATIRLCTG
jgi:hypothetical protein